MRYLNAMLLGFLLILGCQRSEPPQATVAEDPLLLGSGPKDLPGLPNVIRVTDKVLSGGGPHDDGFATLARIGVKTVISVDGARPEVEKAKQHGLRYVHLPISYDGVPRAQALRIARAVRDLPGLVYIHCHHGKHRSPAAAAAVRRCLDGNCSAETATAFLKQAGTAPHYTGLYAAMKEFQAVSDADLDRVPANFPEVTPPSGLVQHMVDVEIRWDHLKQIRQAGWKPPAQHPDLDPAHEALIFREAYRESARLPEVQKVEELHRWMAEAEANAGELEAILRKGMGGSIDSAAAEKAYKRAAALCTQCHGKYRDRGR